MKKVAISGINFFEGGPMSVFKDCLNCIIDEKLNENFEFIVFVHKRELFKEFLSLKNLQIIELPKSRKGYIFRLWYEYIYFYYYSVKSKVDIWFSIHDITPNVACGKRFVYCHNPSPFMKTDFKNIRYSIKIILFSLFYKYLYKINIKRNTNVIVQQNWIRDEFVKMYKIDNIIVAKPTNVLETIELNKEHEKNGIYKFIFPAFPRFFKNFEVICEASSILRQKGINEFEVLLTLDGNENKYSQMLYERYKNIETINFIGLQPRIELFELYSKVDCLIFPSKLETWGLPISEFKLTGKPMIVSDLPYAYETVGDYDKVIFFDTNSAKDLADYMEKQIKNENIYIENKERQVKEPVFNGFNELLNYMLNS